MPYEEAYENDFQGFTETLGDPFAKVDAGREAGAVNGGGANATPNAPGAAAVPPEAIRGLDYAFFQVRNMMAFFEQEFPDKPTLLTASQVQRRAKWIREEMDELEDPEKQTTADQADALLDAIVFAMGGLVELGVLPQQLLDYVIDSQFGKVHQTPDGPIIVKNDLGKVIKPANWEADFAPEPKMRAEIQRQATAGLLSALSA